MRGRWALGWSALAVPLLAVGALATAPRTAPTPAPEFTAPTLGGATVRLADFRGRVVLLDFWATWCGSCRAELPKLTALERDVDGLVVLAVNVDAEKKTVERFAQQVPLPARVLLDPQGKVTDRFAVPALPWQVLVDGQGRIVRQGRRVHEGAAALRQEMPRLRGAE
jgi:thiol-disulfide isomerase/thioredoxin